MDQPKVKFSKEFITPSGLKEWVGTEWPVGLPVDAEAIFATLDKVRDAVLDWHQRNNTPPTHIDMGFGRQSIQWDTPQPMTDDEIESAKRGLETCEYKEDAVNYLAQIGFRYNIELNKIANAKPNRPTAG